MIFKLLLLLLITALFGCQTVMEFPSTGSQNAVLNTNPEALTAEAQSVWTTHESDGVTLRIQIPQGWQSYQTSDGVVLTEHIGTAETAGQLQGILVYIFVPHMGRFSLPQSEDVNMAWAVLNQVVSDPDYVGRALVSDPVAFDWDHHDAAYYLLNNRDGTLTLLLAMSLAQRRKLVVCHISMPEADADRLRPLLPGLLRTLTVNDVAVDASALDLLPDPLVFPVDEADSG